MELWIRSQDRQLLLQTKVLEIDYLGETYVSIRTIYDGISCSLGAYKLEERALEVLDEIQQFVVDKDLADYGIAIYQMPKE